MSALLHLAASPRGPESESQAIAGTFLARLAEQRPDIAVDTWDLWDGTLPSFGPDAVAAKMAVFRGAAPTGASAKAWTATRAAFDRFAAADLYLFTVPMWNHSIPYILKQFIDVVSQPGLVFELSPEQGYTGLLTGKRAVVIYTSAVYGDDLGSAFGVDFQAPYFNDWLRWIGLNETTQVSFRPDLVGPHVETQRRAAHAAARQAAEWLATPTTSGSPSAHQSRLRRASA